MNQRTILILTVIAGAMISPARAQVLAGAPELGADFNSLRATISVPLAAAKDSASTSAAMLNNSVLKGDPEKNTLYIGQAEVGREAFLSDGNDWTSGINLGVAYLSNNHRTVSHEYKEEAVVRMGLVFQGLSEDGMNWTARLHMEDNMFKSKLVSGRGSLDFLLEMRIESCDGKELVESPDLNSSIEETVRHLRSLVPRPFLRCKLTPVSAVAGDVGAYPWEIVSANYSNAYDSGRLSWSLQLLEDNIILLDGKTTQVRLDPEAGQVDAAVRRQSLESAQTFVELVKKYCETLLLEYGQDPVRSKAGVDGFFAKNGSALTAALHGAEAGMGSLTLIEKIWMSKTINQAYRDAKYFEAKTTRKFALDRTIRSFDN